MEKSRIIEVLKDWNFWGKDLDTGVLRKDYVDKLLRFLKTDKVVSLVGVRRSGKSTLMKQMAKTLIDSGVGKSDILMVNFEEPEFENADAMFLKTIYEAYLEIIRPSGKPFVFLDEVQNVGKWERFVRSLNERKAAFITVSGSSSRLASEELGTVLTGRQLYFKTFPLSFGELLNGFEKIETGDLKSIALNSQKIKAVFRDYLEFGGFPEICLSKDSEFRIRTLKGYYEDTINRDVVRRFKVKKIDLLKALARFYLTNISRTISFNKTGGFLHMPTETVRRFSSYLETAHLVFFVDRFSSSLKEQENSPRKVYSIDTGLSNAVGLRFSENFGKLAENMVAVELKRRQEERTEKNMEMYYWRENYEVDFVVKEGLKVGEAIQVCWDVSGQETRERETRALLKAMEKFGLERGLVLTEDFEGEENLKGHFIKFLPLWKWLIEK